MLAYLRTNGNEPISVNPEQVRYVKPVGAGDQCMLFFDGDQHLYVDGTLDHVVGQLNDGLRGR